MFDASDVLPRRNLGAGEEWGRAIEERQNYLLKRLDGQALRLANSGRAAQGALDLGASQGQQIVAVDEKATEVKADQDLAKQIDQSNLFDYGPIIAKDASLFFTRVPNPAYVDGGAEPRYVSEVPNITAWYDDGFTITAPRSDYEIDLGNPVAYKATSPVYVTVSFDYSYTGTYPWPTASDPNRPQLGFRVWVKFPDTIEGWAGYDYPVVSGPTYPASGSYRDPAYYSMTPGLGTLETWRPAIRVRLKNAGDTFTIRSLRVQAAPTAVTSDALPGWIADNGSVPGSNRFDVAPINSANIAGYDTVGLSNYNWVTGGIQVQTPANNQPVRLTMKNAFPVKAGDVLTASMSMEWSETAGSAPVYTTTAPYMGDGGFGLTFYREDGSAIGASTTIGWQNQPGILQGQLTVPPGAVSVKINLYAYIPASSSYVGGTDPARRVWVKFLNPYVGVALGTSAYENNSVTNDKIAGPIDGSKVQIPSASTTVQGLVQLATNAEAQSGVNNFKAVTPASLTSWEAGIRPNRNRAVFVGNSNSTTVHPVNSSWTTWPTLLCSRRGWTQHNYSMNSQSFTTSGTPYLTLAQNAVNGMTAAQRAETGFVFVCDGSSDARAVATYSNVFTAAKNVYTLLRNNFPNAKIVSLPQIWPSESQLYTPGTWNANIPGAVLAVAKAQHDALSEISNVKYLDQSWTWLTNESKYMTATGDVHPNNLGHALIANFVDRALDGETIITKSVWTPVTTTTNFNQTNADFLARARGLSVARTGWDIHIEGFTQSTVARTGTSYDISGPGGTGIPTALRPAFASHGDAHKIQSGGNIGAGVPIEIWANGYLRCFGTLVANEGILMNSYYSLG